MSFLPESDVEEEGRMIEKSAAPISVPPALENKQKVATVGWHIRLWRWLRGYAAEDIGRLKEAGVRQVEAEGDNKAAEAQQKISQAEKNFAEKDLIKQEALLKRAQAQKTLAEAGQIRVVTVVDAMDRLSSIASRIRQNGGEIGLDQKQLEKFILDAASSGIESPEIEEAKEEIENE